MPKHVSLNRLVEALERLRSGFPPAVISFLGMKRAGVDYDTHTAYGSPRENELLDQYFRPVDGAPAGKRYFIPFSPEGWVDARYSGSTLQRARTSQNAAGTVFANGLERNAAGAFRFRPDVAKHLTRKFPTEAGGDKRRINIYDFLAWLRRDAEFPDQTSLNDLVGAFTTEFRLSQAEFDAIFTSPAEAATAFFATDRPDPQAVVRVLGGRLASVVLGDREAELLAALERFLREEERFLLPDGFVRRFFTALKAQPFVILTGKPGTGKTQFIQAFLKGLMDFFQTDSVIEVFHAVSAEFSETDVVGYENLEGQHVPTVLVNQLFDSALAREKRGLFFVIFDEFNLGQADRYLARLLPAIENDQQVALPGRAAESLPPDTFIIATANSYLDESSRLPLSGPVLRRAHVIEIPNALSDLVAEGTGSESQFAIALRTLAAQSVDRIADRTALRGQSFLDEERRTKLQAVDDNGNVLSPEHRATLFAIARTLAEAPSMALTFGVLQDVLDYAMLAGADNIALDEAIVQKVMPQLHGSVATVENLRRVIEESNPPLPQSLAYCDRLIERADHVSGMVQPLV